MPAVAPCPDVHDLEHFTLGQISEDEAERLEHVISEELEQRIDKALGFPTHDPHGDPIPDANLEWPSGGRRTSSLKA